MADTAESRDASHIEDAVRVEAERDGAPSEAARKDGVKKGRSEEVAPENSATERNRLGAGLQCENGGKDAAAGLVTVADGSGDTERLPSGGGDAAASSSPSGDQGEGAAPVGETSPGPAPEEPKREGGTDAGAVAVAAEQLSSSGGGGAENGPEERRCLGDGGGQETASTAQSQSPAGGRDPSRPSAGSAAEQSSPVAEVAGTAESDSSEDVPKPSERRTGDSEHTAALPQRASENDGNLQEAVDGGTACPSETADGKRAKAEAPETGLADPSASDGSSGKVKGQSSSTSTAEGRVQEGKVKGSAAPTQTILVRPNPDPEVHTSRASVESRKEVAPRAGDAQNANNNAKGSAGDDTRQAEPLPAAPKPQPATPGDKKAPPSPDASGGRSGKSYSAQRSSNRGNRKGGTAAPPEASGPAEKAKAARPAAEAKGAVGQEEAARAKGRPGADHGRDKTLGSGKSKDADRESDRKYVDRRDRRDREAGREPRDPRRAQETAPAPKKQPAKSKEEVEREEAERSRREAELKKAEEERKAAELKRQEEEEQRLLEEENTRLAEEEQKHANDMLTEANERKQAKLALRARNLAAQAERPDEDFFVKLDSSMKKNTAFVRKLKTMTEQQRETLTADFNGLNLTKYVGEVATALVESRLKMADVACAVYVCSLMHQRYADFTGHLLQAVQKCHPAQSKKDEASKEAKKEAIVFDSRIRVELRFLAELIVAGVFTEKEGLPALNTLLSSVLKADKESHAHISIIISFIKHCGEDFAGLVPRRNRLLAEKFSLTLPASEFFPAQRKTAYRSLLKEHYLSLTKHLLKEHRDLRAMEKHNRRILQTKGELSEERKKRLEEMQASYQKLLVNTSTYADLIDEIVPDLPEAEISEEEREMMALDYLGNDKASAEFDFDTSLWEDEDTRTFHENLIDLRTMVPGILFKDSEKMGTPNEKQEELAKLGEDIEALEQTEGSDVVTKEEAEAAEAAPIEDPEKLAEEDLAVEDVESTSTSEPEQEDTEEEEEEAEQVTNMSKKMLLDAFLQRLPQCVNRDFIDKAAVEFCMDLNTKINRRKLIKTLFNVPRTRLDLLPFYSRLVATLYPCMPDVGTELVEKLKADFRWHVRKKDQMMIETKIKTVRFIGELTKFKICPKSDTLQCVKILLQDFRHHNIDMVCNLLDSCGRFLYRSSDSHLLTKALLELMMRKRNKLHLIERHSTMVENTFFYCNPPEVKQAEKKERPVMHQYIRKLIYRDLSKTTTEKILKQLRKLDWASHEIKTYITKCLSNVWHVKFNNIHCVASLLAGLVPYHDNVGIQVVDAVLEDIRIGMEINHAKFNQRRVSIVKFLGELYNYRMVESAVIFKTLYSLIRFGITLDGAANPLDPPEHLFRLRLICTLLDTCGQFFDRGSSKKKLDCFLVYFQQYIMYKRSLPIWNPLLHPFPLDNDNALADTLETLRPKMKIHATLGEAHQAVADLEKEHDGYIQMARALVTAQAQGLQQLGTIREDDEAKTTSGVSAVEFTSIAEDEEISDSDSESERTSHRGGGGGMMSGEGRASNSQSQGHSQNTADEEDGEDSLALDSAGETEEEDTVTVLTGGPKLIKCEEDDDFTAEFDKMLSDSVQQRNVDTIKVPQQDIAIPAHARPRPKKMTFDIFSSSEGAPEADSVGAAEEGEGEEAPEVGGCRGDSVNFVLMTRRGNKPQYHEFEVSTSSELAANLRNREMLELAEKRRLKELTLNINDRQEEEDYQEMLAQIQKPIAPVVPVIPKERKPKFNHPKGAPDADQIFNSSGNRKW